MITCFAIIFLALINRARGSDFFGYVTSRRHSFPILFACFFVCVLLVSGDWLAAAIAGAGTIFWAVFAWGKYFMAVHGRPNEGGSVKFIDAITDFVIGKNPSFGYEARLWGTFAMALRGGLFDLPMWLLLFAFVSPYCLLGIPFSFLQGNVYNVAGILVDEEDEPIEYAEIFFGAIRAAAILILVQL